MLPLKHIHGKYKLTDIHSQVQLRTRLKHWDIRKPKPGTVVTVADASSGQNRDNTLMADASIGGHDGVLARMIVEDEYALRMPVDPSHAHARVS